MDFDLFKKPGASLIVKEYKLSESDWDIFCKKFNDEAFQNLKPVFEQVFNDARLKTELPMYSQQHFTDFESYWKVQKKIQQIRP